MKLRYGPKESQYPWGISGFSSMGAYSPDTPTSTWCVCGRVILGTLGRSGGCPKCEQTRSNCKCEWTAAKANYERTNALPKEWELRPMSAGREKPQDYWAGVRNGRDDYD